MQPENVISPTPVAVDQPADATAQSNLPPVTDNIQVSTSEWSEPSTGAGGGSSSTDSSPEPPKNPLERLKAFLASHKIPLIIGALVAVLVINLGISAWLFHRIDRYSALSAVGLKQTASGSNTFNGDNTLFINTKNKSIGVGSSASSPEGLQVGSNVTDTSRGSANVRLGLLNGEPVMILEDKTAQLWQMGVSNGSLQIALGTTQYLGIDKSGNATLAKNLQVQGDTTLGSTSGSGLTIQAGAVSAPNNLNFASNTLFIDSKSKSVAIGANNVSGSKLYVAGNFKADGSVQAGGQFIGVAGSATSPTITLAGNTNTGIYSPSTNTISVTSGGTEVLRVQGNQVSVLNNANLSSSGYIQSGSSSPFWQIVRLTGTLDGSGAATANHGISNASRRVILAMAWYQSGSQAKNLAIDFVSDSQIGVSGGAPGAAWRGMIMYTSDTAGW